MSSRIARSAGLISVATMGSRILGVARETVMAAIFGAGSGPEMDAFNVAFRVPNLLRDLFAEGAMTAAFVPTFTAALITRGRESAWRLGNLVINALLIVTSVLVGLGIVFARPITRAMASGREFVDVPGKLELTTLLTQLMLPFLITVAVAVAMMGMLNSLRRFFVPALSPAMFNIATIACALLLVPVMPTFGLPPIAAVAIGAVIGGLGQIAVQWVALHRAGYRYQPIVDFADPELRQILRLMGPGTLGLAAVQINVFVNTYLATTQPQGAVSWLNYAFRLMYLPIGLFGVSIATAALPEIAQYAVSGNLLAVRRTLARSVRLMLMLNIPATVGLVVLARPIVEVLLQRGRFTASDTAATAAALMFYAPGLIGASIVKIASPTFYALRDARTPVLVSVGSVAVNLLLNLAVLDGLGYRGLALGTSIASLVNAGLLVWLLQRRLADVDGAPVAPALLKILVASLAMGAGAWLAERELSRVLPSGVAIWKHLDVYLTIRLGLAITTGVVILVAAARALRLAELDEAITRVSRRFGRPKGAA
ncbi:MAG: murein biosynthesis integral membrane protein MurJ [Vicinamibacterales bacterium]